MLQSLATRASCLPFAFVVSHPLLNIAKLAINISIQAFVLIESDCVGLSKVHFRDRADLTRLSSLNNKNVAGILEMNYFVSGGDHPFRIEAGRATFVARSHEQRIRALGRDFCRRPSKNCPKLPYS